MGRASSESGASLTPRDHGAIVAAVVSGIGIYLLASHWTYRLGFPLDDSWIHATYARNLALHGDWAFQVGQRSAGSTSPLWTFILAPGYWFGLAPLWWSYCLGVVLLIGLALVAELMVRHATEAYRPSLPWVGIFLGLEWHMLWGAASGMETLLQALLATMLLALLINGSKQYSALGMLTGLSVWVRPDGLTLTAPALLVLCTADRHAGRVRALLGYLLGLGALVVPYLAFNLWLSGTPMPNTFYAKLAEYSAWQARLMPYRVGAGIVQLSTGPLAVLWPGLAISAVRIIRSRNIAMATALIWGMLFSLTYVLRLPPYQHGRYLMPAMPILLLLGVLGYIEFLHAKGPGRYHWAVAWAWKSGLLLLSAGFLLLGARAYGKDVALIESEMVNTAIWANDRLPAGAVIAAHDVGALGYFDHHPLIDLAGLISPEVVPFIRDEARLAELLDQRDAQFLIAFPAFYPQLVANLRTIHVSGGSFAPAAGEDNMTVYCWRCP